MTTHMSCICTSFCKLASWSCQSIYLSQAKVTQEMALQSNQKINTYRIHEMNSLDVHEYMDIYMFFQNTVTESYFQHSKTKHGFN